MTANNNNKRLDHLIMDHLINTTSSFKTTSLSSWTENSRASLDLTAGETSSESASTMAPVQSKLTDIKKQVKKMLQKVDRMMSSGETTDNISNSIHDFYLFMSQRFQGNQIYANTTVDQIEHLMDTTERMLMEDLFVKVTHKIQAEEEVKDLELAKKIKSLNWIMASHLDININLRCAKTRDFLDKAISDLIAMGSKSLPSEKLQCVYSCAQNVCKMLQQGSAGTAVSGPTGVNRNPRGQNNFIKQKLVSADEFLPALVFVVIKSNPPLLQSNIRFITLFSNPNRLSSGEAGYYFTNLCCATAFVEKLTGSSLNLSEDEFNSYVSGECLPPGSSIESSMYLCSDAFRIMYSNISSAEDLIHKQNAIEFEISELKESMINFRKEVKNIIEPSIETSKKFLSIHYSVADDVDEKLIPSFMRDRIREERRLRQEKGDATLLVDLTMNEQSNNNLVGQDVQRLLLPLTPSKKPMTPIRVTPSPPEKLFSVTSVTYDAPRNQKEDALLIDFNSSEEFSIVEDKQNCTESSENPMAVDRMIANPKKVTDS